MLRSFDKEEGLQFQFYWLATGQAFYAFGQLLLLIVLGRFGGAAIVGQYSLALAVTAPIFLFSNMRLRYVVMTDSVEEYSLTEYFNHRLCWGSFSVFVSALIGWFFLRDVLSIILSLALVKYIESLSDLFYGYFQKIKKSKLVSKSLIFVTFTSNFIFIVVFIITKNLIISCSFQLLGRFLSFYFYDCRESKKNNSGFKFHYFKYFYKTKEITKTFFSLSIVGVFGSLSSNSPSYIIQAYLGSEAVGFFAICFYTVSLGVLIVNSFVQPFIARIGSLVASPEKHKMIATSIRMYLCILIVMGLFALFCYLISDYLVLLTLGSEYLKYLNVFYLVVCAGFFRYFYIANQHLLTALRFIRPQALIAAIELLLILVLGLYLINLYGLLGAAFSLLGTFILQTIISFLFVRYVLIGKKRKLYDQNK